MSPNLFLASQNFHSGFFHHLYGFIFALRSLIHLKFILLYGMRYGSNFIYMATQFFQHYSVKSPCLLRWFKILPLSETIYMYVLRFNSGILFQKICFFLSWKLMSLILEVVQYVLMQGKIAPLRQRFFSQIFFLFMIFSVTFIYFKSRSQVVFFPSFIES